MPIAKSTTFWFYTYCSSCNQRPPISRVLIGWHLNFCSPTWPDHRAVARLENVRQLNIRRGKKLSFQLSHRQPVWSNILFLFITPSIVSTEQLFPNQLLFRVFSIWKCYSDVVLFWNAFWLVDLHRQKIYPYIWCLVNNSEWQ